MEVQVLDPERKPLSNFVVRVEVVNEDGPRWQNFKVRAPGDAGHTQFVEDEARQVARSFGFFPTGRTEPVI